MSDWRRLAATLDPRRPVLIAGPTASGKSALALAVAEAGGGTIVNADALQVYADWRVLTARPSPEDEARAPHALYGHVPGDAAWSVGDWLRDVAPLLSGDRAILVGGTGLYFAALTEGLAPIPPTPAAIRTEGDARRRAGLGALLAGIDAATRDRIDTANPARVQRAWEVQATTGRGLADWQAETPPPMLQLDGVQALVLHAPRDLLADRIAARTRAMLIRRRAGRGAGKSRGLDPGAALGEGDRRGRVDGASGRAARPRHGGGADRPPDPAIRQAAADVVSRPDVRLAAGRCLRAGALGRDRALTRPPLVCRMTHPPRPAGRPRRPRLEHRLHPTIPALAAEHRRGLVSRREFLTRATALGLSATAARRMVGAAPAATPATPAPRPGGTLRVQMTVRPLKDTRAYDWSELGNQTRGWFEYLLQYENDGSFTPMLLEAWAANDDATEYVLTVRDGITWSNGDPLTAEHVAWNIDRWCDRGAPGNSMAARMAPLIDPGTGRARDDAITVTDARTVTLRLSSPDISLIPNVSDYPAAIVHPSYDPRDPLAAPGTGPYRVTEFAPGARCVLTRTDRPWWGTPALGGPWLDAIEYVDVGPDPASWIEAIRTGRVDMLHESVGHFVELLDALGLEKSEIVSGATVVVRPNQTALVDGATLYADLRIRRALQLAVDNAVILELGYGNRGIVAENHHVAPIHPEYALIPPPLTDPAAARALMAEAGMEGVEIELTSVDDDWRRFTADAVAAQLVDAGIPCRRTIVPVADFQDNWARYPFSVTNWNHRPLGVQVHALAYRSGTAWNEFGWSNPDFDALVTQALAIADADIRRDTMRQMETLIRADGVTIQPYWRSLFRHAIPGLIGVGQHLAFEHHHTQWAFAAEP